MLYKTPLWEQLLYGDLYAVTILSTLPLYLLKESLSQYDQSLMVKLQRLEISTWLRSLLSEEGNSL